MVDLITPKKIYPKSVLNELTKNAKNLTFSSLETARLFLILSTGAELLGAARFFDSGSELTID